MRIDTTYYYLVIFYIKKNKHKFLHLKILRDATCQNDTLLKGVMINIKTTYAC